jgi:hypothetical protein
MTRRVRVLLSILVLAATPSFAEETTPQYGGPPVVNPLEAKAISAMGAYEQARDALSSVGTIWLFDLWPSRKGLYCAAH